MTIEFTDADKLHIIDLLGLWRPGLYRFPTPEQYDERKLKLEGWYEPLPIIEGAEFGKEWSKGSFLS